MKPILNKAVENVQETKKALFLQTATLINGAFALVAAFAWNEAITGLIKKYIPQGSTLYSQFVYALFITLIVVLVSMRLNRVIKQLGEQDKTEK